MSAICGYYSKNENREKIDAIFNQILMSLAIYGPDGSRIVSGENFSLGYLSAPLDLLQYPEAQQPFQHKRSGLCLTLDGRLSNRDDVIAYLGSASSQRDSDVILLSRLIERLGNSAYEKIKGDYTIVVVDEKKREVTLVRSPEGNRTLFYCQSEGGFAFASTTKSLLQLKGFNFSIDYLSLSNRFLNLPRIYPERTLHKNLHHLQAGHLIHFHNGRIHEKTYYRHRSFIGTRQLSLDESVEGLRSVILKSIEPLQHSRFPISCNLSGGLDSSSVTSICSHLAKKRGARVHAISAVPKTPTDPLCSEEIACMHSVVQNGGNIEQELVYSDTDGPFSSLEDDLSLQDEPGEAISYMNRMICQRAKQVGSRAIITGLGSDSLASQKGLGLAMSLRDSSFAIQTIAAMIGNTRKHPNLLRGISSELKGFIGYKPFAKLLGQIKTRRIQEALERSLLRPAFVKDQGFAERFQERSYLLPPASKNHIEAIADTLDSGISAFANPQRFLPYGIEVLSPLKSQEVVEFCLSIPQHHFATGTLPRGLFRKAMAEFLPSEVSNRRTKSAFIPTFHKNVRAEAAKITELLEKISPSNPIYAFIDPARLEARIKEALNDSAQYQMGNWDTQVQTSIYPAIAFGLYFQ